MASPNDSGLRILFVTPEMLEKSKSLLSKLQKAFDKNQVDLHKDPPLCVYSLSKPLLLILQ